MQAMKDFFLWLLNQLPTFLMSEPIIYFVAIGLGFACIKLLASMTRISR